MDGDSGGAGGRPSALPLRDSALRWLGEPAEKRRLGKRKPLFQDQHNQQHYKSQGQQVGMWHGQLCFPAEIVRLGEFAVEQAREDADDRIEERGIEEFLQGVPLIALVLPPVRAELPR